MTSGFYFMHQEFSERIPITGSYHTVIPFIDPGVNNLPKNISNIDKITLKVDFFLYDICI